MTAAAVTTASDALAVAVWREARTARGTGAETCRRAARADRARRRHAHPAPPRSDARLPLRLPRRHVRFLRDDGERRRALDLPHACRNAVATDDTLEMGPLRNLPVIRDLVTDMRAFFDKWARAQGTFLPGRGDAHDDFARMRRGRGARGGRRRHRVHRLRRVLRVVRRRRRRIRTTSVRRR